jgi:hypothetical protein
MPNKKQGHIVVNAAHELSVPTTAHHAMARSEKIEHSVQAGQKARHEHLSSIKPEQPSTNQLPSLKGLKMANHVHQVFKKP